MGIEIDVLAHDRAALDALEAIGVPVGYADAPAGALESISSKTGTPGSDYLILYPLTDIRSGSNALDPFEDVAFEYQVTIVARLADGARSLVQRVEAALKAISIEGRYVWRFEPVSSGAVRPDFEPTKPPLFTATPVYRIYTTPNP